MDRDELFDWYARWLGARLSLMATIAEVRRLGYWTHGLVERVRREKRRLDSVEEEMAELGLLKEKND